MNTIILFDISNETRSRALWLHRIFDDKPHKYSHVLWGIVNNRVSDAISRPLQELENQNLLKTIGITDDASANLFLDRIEPEIEQWDQEWKILQERYLEDKKASLETLSEEWV